MGVTQQLSRIGGELSPQCRTEPTTNPFASPSDLNQSVSDMRIGCGNESMVTRTPSTPNLSFSRSGLQVILVSVMPETWIIRTGPSVYQGLPSTIS